MRSCCLAVALLGFASLACANVAAAADANSSETIRVEHRTVTAPAGPVVLRGTPPANSNANQPAPGITEGYGSSGNGPTGLLPPDAGYDSSLDLSGLSPPSGFLPLGR